MKALHQHQAPARVAVDPHQERFLRAIAAVALRVATEQATKDSATPAATEAERNAGGGDRDAHAHR